MGSGAGGYVRLTLQTLLSEYNSTTGLLHRISELAFTGAPIPAVEPPRDFPKPNGGLPPGAKPAGKLGLGGVRPAEIQQFRLFARMEDGSLTDMGLTAAQHVTDELCGAFGGRWAGFAVSVSPMGARFKTIADITLKPNWEGGAALPFKIIPIVMAYGTEQFVDHYLLALIAAQATREQVETSVVQPYR